MPPPDAWKWGGVNFEASSLTSIGAADAAARSVHTLTASHSVPLNFLHFG